MVEKKAEKLKRKPTIMLPLDKVKGLISKHSELEKDLSSGEIDKKAFAEKSKEYQI